MYLKLDASLKEKARGKKAVILDVDGCLTDGSLYYGPEGDMMKVFHVLDGFGIKQIEKHGITVIVISGRNSPALEARVRALGITHAVFGALEKIPVADKILEELDIPWENVAVIGDDWPDLALFEKAGFTCAPQNAHPEVSLQADYITTLSGGHGAVREFCDLLLDAQGVYDTILRDAKSGTLDNK